MVRAVLQNPASLPVPGAYSPRDPRLCLGGSSPKGHGGDVTTPTGRPARPAAVVLAQPESF